MLRISVVNEGGAVRLKLEGKLAHEWVREAQDAWTALTPVNGTQAMVVDLRNVSFVDDSGHELLATMRHAGAELIGYGPMISAMLEEIEQSEIAAGTPSATQKGNRKAKAMKG